MFKLRSDFNLDINNGIIGKVGYPRLVSLGVSFGHRTRPQLSPHSSPHSQVSRQARILRSWPSLLIFKSENQSCKTKPTMFPWSKGKNVWFRQCLSEKLSRFHFGSSLHSLGLSGHKEQSSMRKGWVNWHVAACPGTSRVARKLETSQFCCRTLSFLGTSQVSWSQHLDYCEAIPLSPDFWWNMVFLK